MDKRNIIDMSVIIPVYNVEKYLSECIDSLMYQGELRMEIILINDGSTDRSGEIANEYAKKDSRIKILHQEHGGASVARNVGLNIARGEYIAFLDSDDWVKEDSLSELYHIAVEHDADVVMGNIWLCHQNGNLDQPFKQITGEFPKHVLPGRDCFIWLVKTRFYLPSPGRYICRRGYLCKIQARFEEGIMHEDELWVPVVLYHAEKMVITDIEFYYYRQNEESVMHTTSQLYRLKCLFRVTDRLIEFVDRLKLSKEDRELNSWWSVNVFRLYFMAFRLLPEVKDSSYIIPKHHLDRFWRDCGQMIPDSLQRCRDYYLDAEAGFKKYTDWRISDWVATVEYQVKTGKKLMLIYNTIQGDGLSLKKEDVPTDWVVTTDRRYYQQADVIVFYLPGLIQDLESDLEKAEGQVWVSWYLESEKDDPVINDPEIRDTFDLWIKDRQDDGQIEHLLVRLCRDVNCLK